MPWAETYCEDGLQKAVDLVAGWLPRTGRKKRLQGGERGEITGWSALAFMYFMGQILLTAVSTLFVRQEVVWE